MTEHAHSHDHAAVAGAHKGRLIGALSITCTILVAELVGAAFTGSLALLADAGHVLADAIGLGVALLAAVLMSRPPSHEHTWGWERAEVLAAGAQSTLLLLAGVYAAVEGTMRLVNPPAVEAPPMLAVGVLGLVGNGAAAAILAGGRKGNLNMRAAFLEVVSDTLGAIAIIIASAVIWLTGWQRADALAGLFVAALIIPRAIAILRASGRILLETAPKGLDVDEIRAHFMAMEHVIDVHDLHVSSMSSTTPIISAHLVLRDDCFADGHSQELLTELLECTANHFPVHVEHCTFQLENAATAAGHHELHP